MSKDEEAPTEIAPLVGLRRLPTTMDYRPDTADEPTRTLSDPFSTVQRQAISFVTAPNPFRIEAGTVSATEPSRSAPQKPPDTIAPLVTERRFVSSSPLVGAQRPGSVSMPAEQPAGATPLHARPTRRPVPATPVRVQRAAAGTTPSAPRPATHGADRASRAGAGPPGSSTPARWRSPPAWPIAPRTARSSSVPAPHPRPPSGAPRRQAAPATSEATTQWHAPPGPTAARLFAVQRAAADSPASSGPAPGAAALTSGTAIPPAPSTRPMSVTAHAPAPTWASAVQRDAEGGEASSAAPSEPSSAPTPDTTTAPAAPAEAAAAVAAPAAAAAQVRPP